MWPCGLMWRLEVDVGYLLSCFFSSLFEDKSLSYTRSSQFQPEWLSSSTCLGSASCALGLVFLPPPFLGSQIHAAKPDFLKIYTPTHPPPFVHLCVCSHVLHDLYVEIIVHFVEICSFYHMSPRNCTQLVRLGGKLIKTILLYVYQCFTQMLVSFYVHTCWIAWNWNY